MKVHLTVVAARCGALFAAFAWSSASHAQETQSQETPSQETPSAAPEPVAPQRAAEQQSVPGPNTDLIGLGLVTFGAAYLPATIVASSSDARADQHLYVPVAGPWLDFSARPVCSASVGCDAERGYKVLIALDGIVQGLGALMTVAGILSPDPSSKAPPVERSAAAVRVTPAHVGASGYGLAAFGRF